MHKIQFYGRQDILIKIRLNHVHFIVRKISLLEVLHFCNFCSLNHYFEIKIYRQALFFIAMNI